MFVLPLDSIVNDAITLSSNRASEKLAISFAMAQSAKLDVFEERVEETIQQTKHIPQNLATTGSIQYSQGDISKLIGRLFIEVLCCLFLTGVANLNRSSVCLLLFFQRYVAKRREPEFGYAR